jgi:membrane associated rhomboid family serine protease
MFPLRDTIRSYHRPVMTWVLIMVNAVVFLYMQLLGNVSLNNFVSIFGLIPARWQVQPGWLVVTVFTSMFMHGGWLHFLSNMWTLYIFGDNVEDRMGPFGFLLFYLLSGIAAAVLQILIGLNSIIPVIGASGAIAGILGAYIILYPRSRVVTLIFFVFFITTIRIPAIFYLGFWFLSQVYSGLSSLAGVSGGVAWWAHVGGFVFGLLMVRHFLFRPRPLPRPDMYGLVNRFPEDDPFRRY